MASYRSAVFINVVLELPIPHLVCRQEVYLKKSVDWELIRGDVNWVSTGMESSNFHFPVLSLNEGLLLVIRYRVLNRTIVVKTKDKHRAKQRAYRVWMQAD